MVEMATNQLNNNNNQYFKTKTNFEIFIVGSSEIWTPTITATTITSSSYSIIILHTRCCAPTPMATYYDKIMVVGNR